MDRFTADGHIAKEALQDLLNDNLDELGRLELAEHLSFCDCCLEQNTLMMTDEYLVTPEEPLKEPVLKRIRRKAARIFFNKFTTVAAAVVLAVAIGISGLYRTPSSSAPNTNQGQQITFTERFKNFTGDVNQALSGFISSISNWSFGQKDEEKKDQPSASSTPQNP